MVSITRGLIDLGHEVTMLCMQTLKHRYNADTVPKELQQKIEIHLVDVPAEISTVGLIRNFFFSNKPYNAERFISNDYRDRLIDLLKSNSFDIVQLEGLYLAPYIGDIRKNSKALIALRTHNVEHEIWQRVLQNEESALKRLYLKALVRRLKTFELGYINQYDLLVPITDRDGDLFRSYGNDKPSHTSPTGIEKSKIGADYSRLSFPSMFHLGSLDWVPNQEGILWFIDRVLPKVLQEFPDIKFHVAGRNAPAFFVENISSESVVYDGEVENASDYINSMALMVVPLLSGSGMRIKIIEGMAAGKAIATTSVGTEGIPTSNGVNIMIADDPTEMAGQILALLKDKAALLEMGKKALEFVEERFDNRVIVNELAGFYQGALNNDSNEYV